MCMCACMCVCVWGGGGGVCVCGGGGVCVPVQNESLTIEATYINSYILVENAHIDSNESSNQGHHYISNRWMPPTQTMQPHSYVIQQPIQQNQGIQSDNDKAILRAILVLLPFTFLSPIGKFFF